MVCLVAINMLLHNSLVSVILTQVQFIGFHQFCRYNMFNHYFFGGDASRSIYLRFLRQCSGQDAGDVLIVVDPPFGGHVAVLAFTLQCITDDYKNVCPGCMLVHVYQSVEGVGQLKAKSHEKKRYWIDMCRM